MKKQVMSDPQVFHVRALRVKVDLHLRWLTIENFKITKY